MPTKKTVMPDSERAKRIRKTAREVETSNDPADFEHAFAALAKGVQKPKRSEVESGKKSERPKRQRRI
jgi:hypothetical protein